MGMSVNYLAITINEAIYVDLICVYFIDSDGFFLSTFLFFAYV